jgi:hypothetical protein
MYEVEANLVHLYAPHKVIAYILAHFKPRITHSVTTLSISICIVECSNTVGWNACINISPNKHFEETFPPRPRDVSPHDLRPQSTYINWPCVRARNGKLKTITVLQPSRYYRILDDIDTQGWQYNYKIRKVSIHVIKSRLAHSAISQISSTFHLSLIRLL